MTLLSAAKAATSKPGWRSIAPGPAELNPRGYARRRRVIERGLAALVPIVAIGSWQLAATQGLLESNYFPAPSTIASAWVDLIDRGFYQESVIASVQRIVTGYLIGTLSAVTLGLVIGSMKMLRAALEPTIAALYTVPKLAILPLLLLIFGLGESSKILLVALTCFFVVLINTIDAVSSVSSRYLDVGRSCGASRLATLWHITLPAALPQTLTGMRIASGLAVIVIVGAEFVAADAGLGFMVWNSWNLGIPEYMYVGVVSISLIGVLASWVLRGVERLLTPWRR